MNQFVHAIEWIFTAANWSRVQLGAGIGGQLGYHVELSAISLGIAAVVAVPLGMAVGHTRRGQFAAVSIANIGRAIPSFALLVLAFIVVSNLRPSLGFSMLSTIIALVVLAIPPILINTYVGVEGVDAGTVEAARGMGLGPRQILVDIEVPLAAPLIMAGLRTSAVAVVATATLAGFAGGGGLGVFLYLGFAQPGQEQILIGGAILVAVLALLTDVLFALLERAVTPRTRSNGKQRVVPAPLPVAASAAQT
ncbi:MAG TPA: ABC transporter permease [Acidimicrobiales bacterium]|nr:ABC transporter permease [Acidimicrobiales bacterium]